MSNNSRVQIDTPPVVNDDDELQMPDTGTPAQPQQHKAQSGPKGVRKNITSKANQKRKYNAESKIDSDLFRLKLAKANKNVSWDEKVIALEPVEHNDFFHTFDSYGK